ncbi:hypothetical protein [Kineosporia babensis]|uniref:Uncharacterized protein n=1 Tax=Kineosporia babensis TaxID=499548 RepID=A0A9X1NFX2_9ACTN|nr:hypothetical protein [Kineosporia babensis]MCD5312859.1 hypothetical protein [Kineosporia babensis]
MNPEQSQAGELERARAAVNQAGAADLARRPWQHRNQPASDTDLVRFAAWSAGDRHPDPHLLEAGLRLLASARAELDQCEAGLLFAARAEGMTWPQIAGALDLSSPQAAQQRLSRVQAKLDET